MIKNIAKNPTALHNYTVIDKIEAGETFCHKHIIAKWLEEELWLRYNMDVKIPELTNEKEELKKVLKRSKNVKGQLGFDDMDWE